MAQLLARIWEKRRSATAKEDIEARDQEEETRPLYNSWDASSDQAKCVPFSFLFFLLFTAGMLTLYFFPDKHEPILYVDNVEEVLEQSSLNQTHAHGDNYGPSILLEKLKTSVDAKGFSEFLGILSKALSEES